MRGLTSSSAKTSGTRLLRAWCTAALLACSSWQVHASGIALTDDRGTVVMLAAPPRRIVTLLPSLTETVCALGACDRIVGTDRYSNYPVQVRHLPKTGGLDDANVEFIVSLQPDVVLLGTSSRVMERLESLGIKVVALEPRTYADAHRAYAKVALMMGQGDAGEQLWQRIETDVAHAAATVPKGVRGMSVYYEVDSAPYAAGEVSFIGELLSRMGLVNIVPAKLGPFPRLNPEYVVRADPQIIMASEGNAIGFAARPGWARIRALQDGRVCRFSSEEGDVLTRPGPRMGEAAGIMAACLIGIAKPVSAHQ